MDSMESGCRQQPQWPFQDAAEAYLMQLFKDANLCAIHAKWIINMVHDLQHTRKTCGDNTWQRVVESTQKEMHEIMFKLHIQLSRKVMNKKTYGNWE